MCVFRVGESSFTACDGDIRAFKSGYRPYQSDSSACGSSIAASDSGITAYESDTSASATGIRRIAVESWRVRRRSN